MVRRVDRDDEVLRSQRCGPAEQSENLGMNFDAAASDAAYARIRARAIALKMGMMDWDIYKGWRDEGWR